MNKFIVPLLLSFSFCSASLFGQNVYKFIEPNISISYDSSRFKIDKRYSNTSYETEAYDFSCYGDQSKKAMLHIKASAPINLLPKQLQDSLILAGLDDIKNAQNDTFSISNIDKKVREINGFSCAGIVGYDKVQNEYATVISCYHFSNNDYTEINFMSSGNDLNNGYSIVTSFLNGFKSYSKKEIDSEEKLIKSKYSVLVIPAPAGPDNFKYRSKTYIGIVSTKQPLQHKIAEVRITSAIGQEIFSPGENGIVYIILNDSQKGNISKKGELVLLNSFGKKVKLPFSFTYFNKGLQ